MDGGTLTISRTTVRLFGINAPERKQTRVDARSRRWSCGAAVTRRLEALMGKQPVTRESRGEDDYGRARQPDQGQRV